jgi:hypothetical protein
MRITYDTSLVGNRSGMTHSFTLEHAQALAREVYGVKQAEQTELWIRANNAADASKRFAELARYGRAIAGRELAAKMNRRFGLPCILPALNSQLSANDSPTPHA